PAQFDVALAGRSAARSTPAGIATSSTATARDAIERERGRVNLRSQGQEGDSSPSGGGFLPKTRTCFAPDPSSLPPSRSFSPCRSAGPRPPAHPPQRPPPPPRPH